MSILEIIVLFLGSTISSFLGFIVVYRFRIFRDARFDLPEIISLSSVIGTSLLSYIGLVLGMAGSLNTYSVQGLFLFSLLITAYLILRNQEFLRSIGDIKKDLIYLGIVLAISFFNWRSAIGIHSADMGWHAYWSDLIMQKSTLADYSIVEPYYSSVLYTPGAHILMSFLFLFSGVKIEDYFWWPLLWYSLLMVILVYAFSKRIVSSRGIGAACASLYSMAFFPGGFIQRGNLPDLLGFYLLTGTLFVVMIINQRKAWLSLKSITAVCIVALSVLIYHQYAGLVLILFTFLIVSVALLLHRSKVFAATRALLRDRDLAMFFVIISLISVVSIPQLPYLRMLGKSAEILTTSFWNLYAITPSYGDLYISYLKRIQETQTSISVADFMLGLLGLIGMALMFFKDRNSFWIAGSWYIALTLLAFAPLFSVQVEPHRFIWRMTEPLSIFSGFTLIYISIVLNVVVIRIFPRNTKIGVGTLVILGVMLSSFFTSIPVISRDRYHSSEPFFIEDVAIGNWLRNNSESNESEFILIDADLDTSATWVRFFAKSPRLIEKVDFAKYAAPLSQRAFYEDTANVYRSSKPSIISEILKRYNIRFIIARGRQVERFENMIFLKKVLTFGSSSIFERITSEQG